MEKTLRVVLLCAATAIALPAQTFNTLVSFSGTNGSHPSRLVQARDGNFYGTASAGGDNNFGTVFKITPGGTLTTLHSFNGRDGAAPAGLIQATDGNFYGVAGLSIFEITPGGTLTRPFLFTGAYDTVGTVSDAIQAADGNFYGTTSAGGENNFGLVFKITPGGDLTSVYSFNAGEGRASGALVLGTDGNFYGTTTGDNGHSTVYKLTPAGVLTTLYNFNFVAGAAGGIQAPSSVLVQGVDGNFYGTTSSTSAGSGGVCGTVYKLTPAGALTTLHSFANGEGCGAHVLVRATNANFYGISSSGGAADRGTIFQIAADGTLTTLYTFCSQPGTGASCPDGTAPSSLILASNGSLYGTTGMLGANLSGTVFRLGLTTPQPAIDPTLTVQNQTSAPNAKGQAVAPGSLVAVFGTNFATELLSASTIPLSVSLAGVSVSFNGTPAPLVGIAPGVQVGSQSVDQINAIVPWQVAPGTASVVVTRNGVASSPVNVSIAPAAPGIFYIATDSAGVNRPLVFNNSDSTFAYPPGDFGTNLKTRPASIGNDILAIWCTGLGAVTVTPPNGAPATDAAGQFVESDTINKPIVLVGGRQASVTFSGLTQYPSIYQVNIKLDPNTPTGDAVPIQIQMNGVTTTDQLRIAVTN